MPPVPGWAVWTLRGLVLLVAALVLLQSVLAGLFVTGDVGLLEAHSLNASFVTTLAFLQVIAAILVWRPGRGPAWPIWATLASFLLVEVQVGFGYARLVSLHIPMGVALFGLSIGLVAAVFSPSIRRGRSRNEASR
jgi:hypothetical protein